MSRRSMPYHRRYQGDAMNGYRTLTLEQRGAYQTIQDLIYDEFGPIENNERWLAGQMNCSIRKVRAMVSELLTMRKIYLTPQGKISNHRCEEEMGKSLEISRKRAENATKPKSKVTDHSKSGNKNNANVEQMQRISTVIPVPVPDIKNTDSSEQGEIGQGEAQRSADNSHLVEILDRRKPAGQRYADVAALARRKPH